MAGFGSIGSFYFGPEVKNCSINLEPLSLTFSTKSNNLSLDRNINIRNVGLILRILEPEVFAFDDISIDFSANPLIGKSPLEVEFFALPRFGVNFSASIAEYRWYFDYDNYPTVYETTSVSNIIHEYQGKDGDKFSVKLVLITSDRTLEKLKFEYIEIQKSSNRVGINRIINLTNYVPQYLQGTDTLYLVKTFEDYLNEMYNGDEGNYYTLSTDINGVETYEIESTNVNKISVLEKIFRLTELHDPDLIDINNIQYYANNLGYNVDVNKDQFGIGDSSSDVEDYLRFMVGNLPNWYKIKTTRNSLKSMLFSFGLIGDVVYYYTKDYSNDGLNWKYGDIYFDEIEGKLKEDLRQIPSDWFPTSHFAVWYDINKSNTNYSYNTTRQKQIVNAIESVRPANTVFRGIVGRWKTETALRVNEVHRLRKSKVIPSNNSDYWAV